MRAYLCLAILLASSSCLASPSIWHKDYQGPVWHENYQQALDKAKAAKLPLLVYFSGSDWCPLCIKLDKKVLSKDTFQQYVTHNFVLLNIDFPQDAEHSEALMEQNQGLKNRFKVQGFPYMLVIDSGDESVISKFLGCRIIFCSTNRVLNKLKKALKTKGKSE